MTEETETEGGVLVLSAERVVIGLLSIIVAGMVWFNTTLYNQQNATQEAVNQLALTTSQQYVRRDDLAEVKASLLRIEEKLDGKADKQR